MPFCPNPECPHIKATKKPAEYIEGITHCKDCGTQLTDEPIKVEEKPPFRLTDFHKRLLYTLGLIVVWRTMAYIPVPGFDIDAISEFIELGSTFEIFHYITSILALGLMPYISAYVLVEICALFIPTLKSWRAGGYTGRLKLKKTAYILTLIFAFLQGYGIATALETMQGGHFVQNPGFEFRILVTLTLAAATFFTLWIAELITKGGIGHGISILIIASFSWKFLHNILGLFRKSETANIYEGMIEYDYTGDIFWIIFAMLILIGLIVIIIMVEKSYKKIDVKFEDGRESYIPLKLTPGGIVSAGWASSLVMFPATIAGFYYSQTIRKIAESFNPGEIYYFTFLFLLIIFFYFIFAKLFNRPQRTISSLKNVNASLSVPSGRDEKKYINKLIIIMALFGSLYLYLLAISSEIMIISSNIPFYLGGGINLIISVAVVLDLFEEWRIRRKSDSIVKVAEFHDVPKVGLAKSILEQEGIPCYLKGYYHRALLYFFGPYIEVSVMVPEEKSTEATALINKYFG